MADIAIGIDLGTSNSCVACASRGSVEVLPNAFGEKTTASVVAFREDGSISVGNSARANIIHDPEHTIHSAKRLIGRYFFSEEVKKARAICSYSIIEGKNHALRIQTRNEDFSLPEISAMVLRELKSVAEARLGQPVSKAVITVPAYFNDNQRQATIDAGRIAGLDVLRIINEPTAAALAYGFGKGLKQRVAIYDLGGGTFDISVLEIGEDIFEVLAVSGDTFLGGEDFDDRIIDLLADEFVAVHGINLRNDRYALEKLKVAAEAAKCGLSMDDEVEIRIPDVIDGQAGGLSIERTLTRAELGSLVSDLLQRTFKVCDEVLQASGIVARDLDGVVLVGGPTRLPLIRDAVRTYFQMEPRNDVDPDLVVAMGAAIQASALVSPSSDAFLLDVTPLSLRIGIAGGLAETVIERNTPVPIEQTRTFTTFKDHQESVSIRVYQGESREAEQNEPLGQFEFSGFETARRGEVEIDVTFEIDTDGIVGVRARDRRTGKEASTKITLSSGLSESEIQRIIERSDTDRVQTAVAPRGSASTRHEAVQQALSALPLSEVPLPDAPRRIEIKTEPVEDSLFASSDDLDLGVDLDIDLEDDLEDDRDDDRVLMPPNGIGERTTDPMTDESAPIAQASPSSASLSTPPRVTQFGSNVADAETVTLPDLGYAPGLSLGEASGLSLERPRSFPFPDEAPTAENEVFRDDVAATIDLDPGESTEIDLDPGESTEIDLDPGESTEIDLDIEIDPETIHELTNDLGLGTADPYPSSELTSAEGPVDVEPVEGAKGDLFEHAGTLLTADDDERSEG